jgi:hypothetical protein
VQRLRQHDRAVAQPDQEKRRLLRDIAAKKFIKINPHCNEISIIIGTNTHQSEKER